jgi:hypothetical protein
MGVSLGFSVVSEGIWSVFWLVEKAIAGRRSARRLSRAECSRLGGTAGRSAGEASPVVPGQRAHLQDGVRSEDLAVWQPMTQRPVLDAEDHGRLLLGTCFCVLVITADRRESAARP